MQPFEPEHPNDFHVVYDTASGEHETHFSVDTEQSAMQWRRAMEGALFRHATSQWKMKKAQSQGIQQTEEDKQKWTMLRACVPLDRITISGIQDFHSFVILLGLDIDLDDVQKFDFDPSNQIDESNPVSVHHHQHDHPARPAISDKHRQSLGLQRTDSPSTISPTSTETGSSLSRRGTQKGTDAGHSSPATSPGIETPHKKFSLRDTLERAFTPGHSREPSPTRKPSGPHWLDTTIPKPIARAAKLTHYDPGDMSSLDKEDDYSFNIAVQNEQDWFVHSLENAVEEAKKRRYKAGAKRPKMIFNVGGFNCLMTDEELDNEAHPGVERQMSMTSEEDEAEDAEDSREPNPTAKTVKATRKAEKTTMAAKLFGLDEAEGIWRKYRNASNSVNLLADQTSQAMFRHSRCLTLSGTSDCLAEVPVLLASSYIWSGYQGQRLPSHCGSSFLMLMYRSIASRPTMSSKS